MVDNCCGGAYRRFNMSCRETLGKKIAKNMDEYHRGMYSSPSQAIAVSYSQVLKKKPQCARALKRKTNRTRSYRMTSEKFVENQIIRATEEIYREVSRKYEKSLGTLIATHEIDTSGPEGEGSATYLGKYDQDFISIFAENEERFKVITQPFGLSYWGYKIYFIGEKPTAIQVLKIYFRYFYDIIDDLQAFAAESGYTSEFPDGGYIREYAEVSMKVDDAIRNGHATLAASSFKEDMRDMNLSLLSNYQPRLGFSAGSSSGYRSQSGSGSSPLVDYTTPAHLSSPWRKLRMGTKKSVKKTVKKSPKKVVKKSVKKVVKKSPKKTVKKSTKKVVKKAVKSRHYSRRR